MPVGVPPFWDVFASELFGPLLNGGTVLLVEDDCLVPAALRAGIAERGVNEVFLTSSLFNLFVDEDFDSFKGIRKVFEGGERVSPVHVRRFLNAYPDVEPYNAYGPVESTMFATVHRITLDDCGSDVPIGRAFPNTQVYVIRDDGSLCDQEEHGEIIIAGDGLAIGYVADPEGTSKRFAELDIDGVTTRIYKTGDRGWWNADGRLCFGRRSDRQVKIRGRRIEPKHTEDAMLKIPAVDKCAVLPVKDANGDYSRIVAFYTSPTDTPAAEVRAALKQALPEYLVPDRIILAHDLPLLPNGKLDGAASCGCDCARPGSVAG